MQGVNVLSKCKTILSEEMSLSVVPNKMVGRKHISWVKISNHTVKMASELPDIISSMGKPKLPQERFQLFMDFTKHIYEAMYISTKPFNKHYI